MSVYLKVLVLCLVFHGASTWANETAAPQDSVAAPSPQTSARKCTTTTKAALDEAVAAMRTELRGDLESRARQVLADLKNAVPAQAYAQMQKHGTPLSRAQAKPVEKALARQLKASALALDSTSKCRKEEGQSEGYPAGHIRWLCVGQNLRFDFIANDGLGKFQLMIGKSGGKGLAAPVVFTHHAQVTERYGKLTSFHELRNVLFPGSAAGGTLVTDGVRLDDMNEAAKALETKNQECP